MILRMETDSGSVHSVEVLRFELTKVCKPEGRKRPPETGKNIQSL